ncbi:hypothetical protein [Vibrio parahaemolyticus]|uniref:hypothetical protein n=1 Tax=Vibrio parahaemolyticus TaxID=670 RepID=UPI001120D83C|nr:hypothetical protein [Vibrio parahaemolyticus]TOE78559.1 hypothetical protein CGJ36_04385 [Vibrio parahaemolyticus]HCG6610326.1 hypothetical protein [Vibrio parahaemolyticus]HCG7075349.1 hypothetical protein [Vibrio parahaemolyticus]HCG8567999.1 hypothetical protein [Vibrio parahaemolyticus]HCM0794877.1 hypothetical protein [Vibrio parahaemolyticus]
MQRKDPNSGKTNGRDLSKHNFGLGPRTLRNALAAASLENMGTFDSKLYDEREPALWLFTLILLQQAEITRLNDIERRHVLLFAQVLQLKVLTKELTIEEAKSYLSDVNCVLAQARGDGRCEVLVDDKMHYFSEPTLGWKDISVPIELHTEVMKHLSEESQLVLALQRHFGVTFREAAFYNHDKANVSKDDIWGKYDIYISKGMSNNQFRRLPCIKREQRWLLDKIDFYQKERQKHTLIPAGLPFKEFEQEVYRQTKQVNSLYCPLGERAHFACDYYYSKVRVRCPSQANIPPGQAHYIYIALSLRISVEEAQHLDHTVRASQAEILGEHGAYATDVFLGGI